MDFIAEHINSIIAIASGGTGIGALGLAAIMLKHIASKKAKKLNALFCSADRSLGTIRHLLSTYDTKAYGNEDSVYQDIRTMKIQIDNTLECLADIIQVIPALKNKAQYLRDIIKINKG